MPFSGRPRSLSEVAAQGSQQGNADAFLREFLDEFYTEQSEEARIAMLTEEPQLFGNERQDSYLAAVAEHLARRYRLPIPEWVEGKERFLKKAAWFPCGLESLKAILIRESPTAFRRRMIFVGSDPLYRPRRDKPSLG